MTSKLLILHADKSMEVQFDQQITIGRDVFNSLSLQDAEVSRSHAIIFEQDGETILKDLKSRNGCFVQGDKAAECTLQSGDELIMGGTVIIFDPPEDVELSTLLSKRGRYLLEKRAVKTPLERPTPPTTFTRDQMEEAIDKLFDDPDSTSFFTVSNALLLLKAIKDMDDAPDAGRLFDCAVSHALAMLGGHRGVIMEVDATREHLKVRSLMAVEETDTITIAQPILRIVLGSEKCLFCSDIVRDRRFAQIGRTSQRPIHSFVAAPIVGREELYGFIYLDAEDNSVSYDYTAVRSLYVIAGHLGALLRKRPMHFPKHAVSSPALHAPRP